MGFCFIYYRNFDSWLNYRLYKSKVGDRNRVPPEGSLIISMGGATLFPGLLHFTLNPECLARWHQVPFFQNLIRTRLWIKSPLPVPLADALPVWPLALSMY